ncbi:MAG: CRISPR-associated helicase Cas3' [Thiothrix sp.]|nr:MAG: CRISPR-associated helicase Cas3' [Thiothrix sp.]
MDLLSNSNFFKYWGKAKQPIEVDYALMLGSDAEIAARYHLTEAQLQQKAKKLGWQRASSEQPFHEYHLLPYHSLDVAAVGYVLLTHNTAYLKYFSQLTQWNEKDCIQWLTFLLALHDLGKFTESFQNLKPDLFKQLQKHPSVMEYSERHDSLGWLVWNQHVKALLAERNIISLAKSRRQSPTLDIDSSVAAMVGHHGQPPRPRLPHEAHAYLNPEDFEAVTGFIDNISPFLLEPNSSFPICNKEAFKLASWWLSGFAVLSDWLGSNTDYFPYHSQPMPLKDYWAMALEQAQKAIQQTELVNCQPNDLLTLTDLLPKKFDHAPKPTPLQALAGEWPISQSPHLFILEDVTGAGKTEAAILLASRLMRVGQSNSLYFALPTMATANGMYGRMSTIYRHLFMPNANPSLILAHGASDMVKDFKQSVLPKPEVTQADYGDGTTPAGAHCNAWLADNNKKALLADIGIGTIDQALLAILPSRHQSLRLLGLLNKTFIADEIHASDAYQHELLLSLLRAHAAAGGSAILLSATLPQKQRQSLVSAFAEGAGWADSNVHKTDEHSYPLLTCLTSSGLQEAVVATRESVKREVKVSFLSDQPAISAVLENVMANGQCACWIRNTVKDAIEAYETLKAEYPDWQIDIFHARYALGDRLDIEKRVMTRFDDKSSSMARSSQLLIATQVVEQSLDLDFDYLISDLAPIDLLIQRAGRLRRHSRDRQGDRITGVDQRGQAVLHVYAPDLVHAPTHQWYANFFPNAQKVYSHHGQLWLTAKLLEKQGQFKMPEDARSLIEGVYGDDAQAAIPDTLLHRSSEAEGSDRADASLAQLNALTLEVGYDDSFTNLWWDEAKTPTRLGEATVQVYLAKWQDGKLKPWYSDKEHAWALSAVSMRAFWISGEVVPEDIPNAEWERCKASLPAQGKWGVLLPLRLISETGWEGQALRKVKEQDELVTLIYDARVGLRIKD